MTDKGPIISPRGTANLKTLYPIYLFLKKYTSCVQVSATVIEPVRDNHRVFLSKEGNLKMANVGKIFSFATI